MRLMSHMSQLKYFNLTVIFTAVAVLTVKLNFRQNAVDFALTKLS